MNTWSLGVSLKKKWLAERAATTARANANIPRNITVSSHITGVNHNNNKEDIIQEAVHQAAVNTVVVKDIEEEKEDKEDDDTVVPPPLTYGSESFNDSDSEDEDEDEPPPAPPFGRG